MRSTASSAGTEAGGEPSAGRPSNRWQVWPDEAESNLGVPLGYLSMCCRTVISLAASDSMPGIGRLSDTGVEQRFGHRHRLGPVASYRGCVGLTGTNVCLASGKPTPSSTNVCLSSGKPTPSSTNVCLSSNKPLPSSTNVCLSSNKQLPSSTNVCLAPGKPTPWGRGAPHKGTAGRVIRLIGTVPVPGRLGAQETPRHPEGDGGLFSETSAVSLHLIEERPNATPSTVVCRSSRP